MLVKELREEIKKYNKKDLENIIIELYKRIPKSKKEDYNIDEYIKNMHLAKTPPKQVGISFENLENEITYFIKCVDNEWYVIPNRVISKKERSSWRFKVKNYYKQLISILPTDSNGNGATELLIDIFKRLSIGSNRLLFINWNTFRAIGISQSDYYDVIVKRILHNGYMKDSLIKCINLLDVPKDPEEFSQDMYNVFISNLKTSDTKLLAIELLNDRITALENERSLAIETKRKGTSKNKIRVRELYDIEYDLNHFALCITNIYFMLKETKLGINYFQKHYIASNKEVKEYILLGVLDDMDLYSAWIEEYERHIGKIDYRDSLKERYKELKNMN